jgi:hypothetical protein
MEPYHPYYEAQTRTDSTVNSHPIAARLRKVWRELGESREAEEGQGQNRPRSFVERRGVAVMR